MTHDTQPLLTPRLIVAEADKAIAFYQDVFGAELVERYAIPTGQVVHAGLKIGASSFSIFEGKTETPGPSVLLHLAVPDPDAIGDKMLAQGSTVIIPIEDRPYGKREGRIQDPFGQFWILSKTIEELSPEQIQDRLQQM